MKIAIDNDLTAYEVVALRELSGLDGSKDEWEQCLKQNLANVTARDDKDVLIGAGFLCGNRRHAEIVDLFVHPDYREQGTGRGIVQLLVAHAFNQGVKYLSLAYNKKSPWLKEFYESEGFELIDFAMWHTTSLKSLQIEPTESEEAQQTV